MPRQRDEDISPGRLNRLLMNEARRLSQHARHLSKEEFAEVRDLVERLSDIHSDDASCRNLRGTYGDKPRPWGTKYTPAWEQAVLVVFSRRR